MIAVIDYGLGNLRSVCNAVAAVDGEAAVCTDPAALLDASAVILPGVGAFGSAMANLREGGWIEPLQRSVREQGKPFLGICLGMQVITRGSSEHGEHDGLGWIDATVTRLPKTSPELRIPHIAWNDVTFTRSDSGLSTGLEPEETFYFVHSYAVTATGQPFVKGTTHHGTEFVACLEDENIWATQFHPEKSQQAGLRILRNFVERSR
ncbi:MAG: imidazole glycerol phosphate synthase subunit HisH [bacterium]